MSSVFKILEKKPNLLLDRTELKLSIYHEGGSTPSKQEIAKFLSEQLSTHKEHIVIHDCKTRFGTHVSHAQARVYNKKTSMESLEHKYMLKRMQKEKYENEEPKMPRKLRKEEKNKNKKIRGTKATYLKKAAKRQEKQGD